MLGFLKQYVKDPVKIGAMAPSSCFLADKMVEEISFLACDCIVEFGPGTGVFTEKILARKKQETKFIVIEQEEEFYNRLIEKYGHRENVVFYHGSAEDVRRYIREQGCEKADYVISGLPFTSLPKEVSRRILRETNLALAEDGIFYTFQYSLVKKKLFQSYFKIISIRREMRNFPPAYVLGLSAKLWRSKKN